MKMRRFALVICLLFLVHCESQQQNKQQTGKLCANCYYGITRNNENEYLMIKNILKNLYDHHVNITMDATNNFEKTSTKFMRTCDVNIDFVCIKQAVSKDYRHPNHLFKSAKEPNETVKSQYESSWFSEHKFINVNKHENKKFVGFCNNLGLKLYCLLYDYVNTSGKFNACKLMSIGHDDTVSSLIDYYIAQTFLKSCYGNLEMIAKGFYKLLKFDCERAYTMKSTYFTSKYLNLFRTCDPYLNLNDLINANKLETNCSSTVHNYRNKKHCVWYEAICKYPLKCLKTMNWTDH